LYIDYLSNKADMLGAISIPPNINMNVKLPSNLAECLNWLYLVLGLLIAGVRSIYTTQCALIG
jgi:hypothetical protein